MQTVRPFTVTFKIPRLLLGATLAASALSAISAGAADLAAPATAKSQNASETLSAFQRAAQSGDLEQLQRLLARDPGLATARAAEGQTALHAAAFGSNSAATAFLLDHGADVNAIDAQGRTPLGQIVSYSGVNYPGRLAILEVLVARGADVNRPDERGDTPLHLAVVTGNQQTAIFLSTHGARDTTTPVFDALARDDMAALRVALQKQPNLANEGRLTDSNPNSFVFPPKQFTPLHAAVFWNHPALVQVLIEAKANVRAAGPSGKTPLHDAATLNELEIATLLLDAGADPNARKGAQSLIFRGRSQETGQTPLHLAAGAGALAVSELLLKRGAAVDAQTSLRGREFRPAGQISTQAVVGKTPLQYAVTAGSVLLVELLLGHGANVHGPANDDAPLLSALPASWRRNLPPEDSVAIVRALLRAGANPNARDLPGSATFDANDTALSKAVGAGDFALATLLLDTKADVNRTNSRGDTPLRLALVSNFDGSRDAMVAQLLKRGANVNARDKAGRTPIFEAVKSADLETTRQLLARGAEIGVRDNKGLTPLSIAYDAGYDKVTTLLRAHGASNATVSFFDAIAAGDAKTVTTQLKTSPLLLHSLSDKKETPLVHALRHRQNALVALLLARGADVETRSFGEPALFSAANTGDPALVRLILRHGAQINEKSDEGYPVLFRAVAIHNSDKKSADLTIVSLLLRSGANVRGTDKSGQTALHICAVNGTPGAADTAAMEVLLRAGADVSARDKFGQTPLHLASQSGKLAAAKWLVGHGAQVDLADKQGQTPLSLAKARRDAGLVALLQGRNVSK